VEGGFLGLIGIGNETRDEINYGEQQTLVLLKAEDEAMA